MFQEIKPRVKTHSFIVESMTSNPENTKIENHRLSYEPTSYMLPPNRTTHIYTLVLDLDETLVHYDHIKQQFRVRPFCRDFLS